MAALEDVLAKVKETLSEDEKKILDKLAADAASFSKAADSDGDGKPDAAGIKALFLKNGEFSKTSTILVLSWAMGLGLWFVQSVFQGFSVLGVTIPAFDSGSALSMLGAASTLYMATHNVKVNLGASPSEDKTG